MAGWWVDYPAGESFLWLGTRLLPSAVAAALAEEADRSFDVLGICREEELIANKL
jgi:hypothetical protein